MAQQIINPVIPKVGLQGEAIAGSSGVIFTATDRQLIKELAGEVNRSRPFKEIFSEKGLTPHVENEETTVNPEQDIKALESRYRDHRQMLKESPTKTPQEKVEISEEDSGENYSISKPPETRAPEFNHATAAIARELNLNPAEIFDKFALEQNELHALIFRIKELHLKRLLCGSQKEFEEFTAAIKKETLSAGRKEARAWLESQLDNLTRNAVEYKLRLLKSMQAMESNEEREKEIKEFQAAYASEG